MKNFAMYLNLLIVTPIPVKANQSNNKTIEENLELQQQFVRQ